VAASDGNFRVVHDGFEDFALARSWFNPQNLAEEPYRVVAVFGP
jgi:hypothetical protein